MCMVPDGDTPIEIKWTFEGKELSPVMGYNVGRVGARMSILYFKPVSQEYGGAYACVASNPSGNDTHEAILRVHG